MREGLAIMKITYKSGKMIVTHESGVVNEYTKADIENFKTRTQQTINELNAEQSNMTLKISDINNS